ncbi:nucleoside hydrolase [Labedella endophytica]|nr:nucleoside hydrolase [Labedella endophytica]
MNTPHRVILDTDIGSDVDDLMALVLLLGTPSVELVGVTTVYGDTALRARLAHRVLGMAGAGVPVHAGVREPLSGREVWWAGHEGALYPDLEAETYDSDEAVRYLVDTVLAAPGEIDVIAIGPLTNIAAALTAEPRFAESVRHLWVMGGDFADGTPEHNLRSDAVAARIVFDSGMPITITGLEVTRRIDIRAEQLERIAQAGELGELIRAEIEQWWAFWDETWNVPHDPVTVLTLVAPDLFEVTAPGHVEIGDGEREGCSTHSPGEGRTRVVTTLDVDAVGERIVAGIVDATDARPSEGE